MSLKEKTPLRKRFSLENIHTNTRESNQTGYAGAFVVIVGAICNCPWLCGRTQFAPTWSDKRSKRLARQNFFKVLQGAAQELRNVESVGTFFFTAPAEDAVLYAEHTRLIFFG